jgi:hypothetical protein
MADLNVEPLARDAIKSIEWEIADPVYRVDFWHRPDPPLGVEPDQVGYKQHSYEIRNAAGLEEVRIWAEENANGRLFVVYVQIPAAPDGPGVVRITGKDPTWPD